MYHSMIEQWLSLDTVDCREPEARDMSVFFQLLEFLKQSVVAV